MESEPPLAINRSSMLRRLPPFGLTGHAARDGRPSSGRRSTLAPMLLLALVLTGLSGCVLPFGASRKVMPGMVRVVGRGMSGAEREARGS